MSNHHYYLPQEELVEHNAEHARGQVSIRHRYCICCFPTARNHQPSLPFRNFWNWFYTYYNATGYTDYTYTTFQTIVQQFQESPSTEFIRLTAYLISSICYRQVHTDEFWLICLAFHKACIYTNCFNNRVSHQYRQRIRQDIL